MLKETETEETLDFAAIIFIIGGISIWGAGLLLPFGCTYDEVGSKSLIMQNSIRLLLEKLRLDLLRDI